MIRSRGFKEEAITSDHPGFKATEEHFKKMKESISPEEYEKLMKEMNELMGDPNKKKQQEEDEAANRDEHFFDPEEKANYEKHESDKKMAEKERQARIEKNRSDGAKIVKGEEYDNELNTEGKDLKQAPKPDL